MDIQNSPSWFNKRPAVVFMICFYCAMVALQAIAFMVDYGFEMARIGDVSILSMFGYCLVSILILVGGLQLFLKKQSCRVSFAVALVLGVIIRLLQLKAPVLMSILAAPALKEYALVFGILVYCLQLGSQGYFATNK